MIYKYFYFNVNICIYLFNFINENVEEPLGGAVLVFFFWNLIRMKTLQFKYLFGRIFFFT